MSLAEYWKPRPGRRERSLQAVAVIDGQQVAVSLNDSTLLEAARARDTRITQIYFIRVGDTGPIKIGTTDDPAKRLSELQTGNPEPLRIVKHYAAPQYRETELHLLFAEDWIRGEWFRPSVPLLAHIRQATS